MATLTVRGIDDDTKARLRLRAAQHGRSMEAEVRALIREAVLESGPPPGVGLGTWLHEQLSSIEGLEIPERDRSEMVRAVDFDDEGPVDEVDDRGHRGEIW